MAAAHPRASLSAQSGFSPFAGFFCVGKVRRRYRTFSSAVGSMALAALAVVRQLCRRYTARRLIDSSANNPPVKVNRRRGNRKFAVGSLGKILTPLSVLAAQGKMNTIDACSGDFL
jgi:hypothetical protein